MKLKYLTLGSALFLLSCSNASTCECPIETITYDYIDIYSNIIDINDIFTNDNSFMLYIYNSNCKYCNQIKNDIIPFIKENKAFVIDCNTQSIEIKDKRYELVGVNNVDDFFIYGYPMLILFENKMVSRYYLGITEIMNFIS